MHHDHILIFLSSIAIQSTARVAVAVTAAVLIMACAASPAAVLYSFPLDTNPGWTCEGQWQFGKPQGKGTYPYDPLTGFTGTNVYGYNLAGDYANNIPAYYLTTTPLDFSQARNVTLIFRRWLGVEAAIYDHAVIEASYDGITWTTVWRHTGSTLTDTSWRAITNSLAFVADGRANVYVRWGMGPTDYTVTYYGWNIDDIVFEGELIDDLAATPTNLCTFTGVVSGPFSPAAYTVTLTNTGTAPLAWQAHTNAAWLSVTSVSGTLSPGASSTLTAALTSAASSLTSAVYAALLVCSNLTSGVAHHVPFRLTVQPPGAALVHFFDLQTNPGWSTQGQWAFGKPQGGGSYNKDPLAGYTGTNVFGYNLAGNYESSTTSQFFLTTTALDCSYATGITLRFWRWLGVGPSYYDRARVEISTNGIRWHTVWENSSAVSDTNWIECVYPIGLANNRPLVYVRWGMGPLASYDPRPGWNIDDIALTGVILEGLRVAPAGSANASGQRGGPFAPSAFTYELRNAKNDTLTWRASVNAAWVTLTPASGTLTPGATTLVTAALNDEANRLTTGTHTATIIFSNTVSGATYTRPIVLTVRPRDPIVAYGFYMDTNPGWATQGQWQFGKPLGLGSGKRDPLTGYTGTNVYGYNLAGDYSNNIPKYTLTTAPLDCSNLENVSLRFWRWLGVEQSSHDKATIEVSDNGTTWTTIWQNGANTIDDGAWTNCVYNISAFADRKPTVYIRWGMGPTDYTQTYCGWNLDDIEIIGRLVDDLTISPADGLAAQGYRGGPITPPSKFYTLRNVGGAPLPWTATYSQPWLTITPTSGTLAPGATQTVSVAFNSHANSLAPGAYADTIIFANTNSGVTQTRPISLTIISTPRITVQPQEFSITVMPGQVATRVMSVGNAAGADANLNFSLTINAAAQTAAASTTTGAANPSALPHADAPYVPGEMLVRFVPAALPAARANLLAALPGATITREYELVKGLVVVAVPPSLAIASAQATAQSIPGVSYAEPNYLYFTNAIPNDPRFSELWGLHNTGQTGGTPDADIDAPEAWDIASGSRNLIVAVIDTGVDYTHPDLASNMWRNPGEIAGNGIDDDGNGFVDDIFGYDFVNRDADPMDDHNHGTHCAGTIAAVGNNGIGVAGVCWRARIMALKSLSSSGSGSSADAISCIEYATRMGARVLNNSWGGGGYSQALKDAIDMCGASGIVFCAAAGNAGTNNDTTPHYPSSYDSANIIAVMATDHNDQRSSFSCYGATSVDIGAPGSAILSTVRGGSYSTMSGTSMATPHVSGACTLLLSHNPALSVAELQTALYTTVDPKLPGLCVSGGRLNLARALAAARSPWLSATPMAGTNIAPGAAIPVTLTANAAGCATGTYAGNITITCNDVITPSLNVPVTMLVKYDDLSVETTNHFLPRGRIGGPFSPAVQAFVLRNTGYGTLTWTASAASNWIALSPASGSLHPGASATVTASVTALASTFGEGIYRCPLVFRNTSTGVEQTRLAILTIYTVPAITVTPVAISVTNYVGGTATRLLNIGNIGDGTLTYTITPRGAGLNAISAHTMAPAAMQAGADNLTLEYTFSMPQATLANGATIFHLPGAHSYKRAGKPIVPVLPVAIAVPFGNAVADVQVEVLEQYALDGTYDLAHASRPHPLSRPPVGATARDAAVYSQTTPWPGRWFESLGIQSTRGYQILRVNLFPLQYVPAAQHVTCVTRLKLAVSFAPAQHEIAYHPDPALASMLARHVANPATLFSYPPHPVLPARAAATPCSLEPGTYDYLIITDPTLAAAPGPYNFQALRDTKIARGVSARIVTTDWIYQNYSGTRPDGASDNQTRIRNFLIDAYQTWGTRYALLGGASAIIPARMFWVDSFAGEVDTMPCDMYYGCVEPAACTFDGDADGTYGEPTDGPGGADVDLSAEIAIGRAPVANASELASFVRKTLAYESSTNVYLPRITMLGEHLGFGGSSEYATLSMEQIRLGGLYDSYFTYGFSNHVRTGLLPFNLSRNLYDGPGASWPAGALVALINSNVHVLNHLGHANVTYAMKLYTSQLAQLTNSEPCFIYSQGCLPGAFDSSGCFAERVTVLPKGAFAAVMNARYGWGEENSTDGPSHRFNRQYWDAVLGEGIVSLGRANQDSKEDNLWDIGGECIRWCYYELNLFGCPETSFRFTSSAPADWLSASPASGSVAPNAVTPVSVACAAGARAPGLYQGELFIACNDPATPSLTVPVTMTVIPDTMNVTPTVIYEASGIIGGPFTPATFTYFVSNASASFLTWQATKNATWLNLSPNGGTLAPGARAVLTLSIASAATNLAVGLYSTTIIISNLTTGSAHLRAASLDVKPVPPVTLYEFALDGDPQWSTQGQWQFGRPQGRGGEYGGPDPSSARTGLNVYGYNLNGDYENNMPQYHLTTTPLDCSNARNVQLKFWRWLGVEKAQYDRASIQVSRNAVEWTTVWQNGNEDIADYAWTEVSYDISSVADGQPTVYIRWTMGPTDESYRFCGWNIDDISILGHLRDPLFITPGTPFVSAGRRGGPFTPAATLYVLHNKGATSLTWSASAAASWLIVAPASGTLPVNGAVTVTVALTSAANALPEGLHTSSVTFSNLITGFTQQRSAQLTVFTSPIIQVAPPAFTFTNFVGASSAATLSVGNAPNADAPLTFSLQVRQTASTTAHMTVTPHSVPSPPTASVTATSAAYVLTNIFVRFKRGTTATLRSASLAALPGAAIAREFTLVDGLTLVNLPPTLSVAEALARLTTDAAVLYAEPNYLQHICATPNDPRFSELWGLQNTGQTGGAPDADLDAPEAWDIETGSHNVIVAVIDTGVDYTHPDLASNMWRNPGEIPGNGRDDDANGFIDDVFGYDFVNRDADPMDDHNHGTHCAGSIAAVGNNALGVVGVCWRARIMALKFLSASGSGSTDDAILCIQYATRMGARVMNNSWGGGGYSQALKDAIDAAGATGVIFCAAAGNNGTDNDITPRYPASYNSPNIIAVLSTDHTDQRSSFSCYGATSVDIGAPGSAILSTVRGGSYSTMSGTSMATPHVSGACALLLARNPMLFFTEVQALLYSSVDPTLPGLCVSGGRLNLARAIAAASDPWLAAEPLAGTNIAPGAALAVTVTATAGALAPGAYQGELIISCNDRATPTVTIPVTMLVVVSNLIVTPEEGLVTSGLRGGPFAPPNKVYTLTNPSATQTLWAASSSHPWLDVTPTSGALAPGASTVVTVALNAAAAALPTGFFSATITFTASGGASFPRPVLLTVLPPPEPPAPPAPPTGITASDGLFSHAVLISWNASSGATAYLVFRNTVNTTNTATPISPQLTTLSYHDTNVIPGTLYYYWVRAANSNGWSAFSNGDSGFASADPHIAITTPSQTVAFHQTTIAISGTNNNNIAGVIMWENYQGLRIIDSGVIPAHSPWTIPVVTLATGDNEIWVWCTNHHGAEAWDNVLITRQAAPPAQIHHFTIRLAPDFITPILSWSNVPASVLACTNRYYTRAAAHWFTRAANVSPPWPDTLATQWPSVYYRLVAGTATSAYDVGKFTVLIRQAQSSVPVENWVSSPFDFMDEKGQLVPSIPFDVLGVGQALNNESRTPTFRDAVYSQQGVGGELLYASRGNGVWHLQHPSATNWYRNQLYKLVVNRAHTGAPKPLTFFGRVSTNDPAYVADIQQSDGASHRQNWVPAWFPWLQSFDQARIADVVTDHPGAPPNRDAVYSQASIGGSAIYASRGTNTWITTAPAATNLFPGHGYIIIIRRPHTGPARPWRNPRSPLPNL